MQNNQEELIAFESQIIKTDDLLIFKSKYRYDANNQEENNDNHTYEKEEVNTFAIVKSEKKNLFGPKLKYLLHLVNNNLEKIYVVSKKYQFENGISENFTLLSMKEKELIDDINNSYEKTIKTKR